MGRCCIYIGRKCEVVNDECTHAASGELALHMHMLHVHVHVHVLAQRLRDVEEGAKLSGQL